MTVIRHDFPASDFPITVEALHPETRRVVWRRVIPAPEDTELLTIPPLRKILGHPVIIRIRFGDGRTEESAPPPVVQ